MNTNRNYKVTDEEFIEAVKSSRNTCEALKKLNMNFRGAAYKQFKLRCRQLNLDLDHFLFSDSQIRKHIKISELQQVVLKSQSRMDCLKQLNLRPDTNANVNWIIGQLHFNDIKTDHWLGMGHLKGKHNPYTKRASLEEVLVNGSVMNSTTKRRLIREGILEYKCNKCGISEWNNKYISLQLEHTNGNNMDNRLENLELLCPNCHSQTETFCRKKSYFDEKEEVVKKQYNPKSTVMPTLCLGCKKSISPTALRCKRCTGLNRNEKIEWPSDNDLIEQLKTKSRLALSKELGVSDNAIKKRLKHRGLI